MMRSYDRADTPPEPGGLAGFRGAFGGIVWRGLCGDDFEGTVNGFCGENRHQTRLISDVVVTRKMEHESYQYNSISSRD